MEKEEKKISVPKFATREDVEELTEQSVHDYIKGQEIAIEQSKKEVERRNKCIDYYEGFLEQFNQDNT